MQATGHAYVPERDALTIVTAHTVACRIGRSDGEVHGQFNEFKVDGCMLAKLAQVIDICPAGCLGDGR